jgi:tRNA-binding protein
VASAAHPAPESPAPLQPQEFDRVDIRIGVVVEVEEFPEARRPAYKLRIDFGPLGIKRSSARITDHYRPADLVGRHVVAVVNFPPKRIGPVVSEVLVLGAYDAAGAVVLLRPDQAVEPGSKIG